jgi:hypothetical protein
MNARIGVLLLAAAGCTHLTPFSPRALAGQTFSLRPGWSMVLAVDGSVGGHPAEIRLAVEEPLSRVTEGCFASPPEVVGRVDTGGGKPDGGPGGRIQDAVVASEVQLGSRILGDVRALRDTGAACQLTLGSEVLMAFVLGVNPEARTATFHAQMPAAPAFESEDSVVLELTRDPRTDRPSLAVQLDTGGRPLTVPMGLATGLAAVELSPDAGRALVGADVAGKRLALTSLALAPDWVLRHVDVSVLGSAGEPQGAATGTGEPGAPASLSGVLGADAWGHYRILLDLKGQRVVLYRRPPPVEGQSGPESWTHLSSDTTASGSLVRFISWQMLDRGGRVALEPAHVRLTACRVGLTLGPDDPGASLEVAVPWAGLERDLPACAQELATVRAWTGALEVSGPLPCAGTCVYAQEVSTGRTVCSCADRRLAETLRARKTPTVPAPSEEPEPKDPAEPRPKTPAKR